MKTRTLEEIANYAKYTGDYDADLIHDLAQHVIDHAASIKALQEAAKTNVKQPIDRPEWARDDATHCGFYEKTVCVVYGRSPLAPNGYSVCSKPLPGQTAAWLNGQRFDSWEHCIASPSVFPLKPPTPKPPASPAPSPSTTPPDVWEEDFYSEEPTDEGPVATPNQSRCGLICIFTGKPEWFCTRERGHAGDHVARSTGGQFRARRHVRGEPKPKIEEAQKIEEWDRSKVVIDCNSSIDASDFWPVVRRGDVVLYLSSLTMKWITLTDHTYAHNFPTREAAEAAVKIAPNPWKEEAAPTQNVSPPGESVKLAKLRFFSRGAIVWIFGVSPPKYLCGNDARLHESYFDSVEGLQKYHKATVELSHAEALAAFPNLQEHFPLKPATEQPSNDRQQRIVDRCPSCRVPSLFIGSGGHLTCGNLECKEPGVSDVIDSLKSELQNAYDQHDGILEERDEAREKYQLLQDAAKKMAEVLQSSLPHLDSSNRPLANETFVKARDVLTLYDSIGGEK